MGKAASALRPPSFNRSSRSTGRPAGARGGSSTRSTSSPSRNRYDACAATWPGRLPPEHPAAREARLAHEARAEALGQGVDPDIVVLQQEAERVIEEMRSRSVRASPTRGPPLSAAAALDRERTVRANVRGRPVARAQFAPPPPPPRRLPGGEDPCVN